MNNKYINILRWSGRDIDFFYPRLCFLSATLFLFATVFLAATFFLSATLFFLRDSFFFSATLFFLSTTPFFNPRLFFLIRAFSSAVLGSRTLKSRPAGNIAAAMAGEDREEKEQGSIRKVNMLSYFWYQFIGKKGIETSHEYERYTQYI